MRKKKSSYKKPSQAALDFLLSWGLVLAIVAIAVFILFELGIFTIPSAPVIISGFHGVTVTEVGTNSSLMVVKVVNGLSKTINLNTVSVTIDNKTYTSSDCVVFLVVPSSYSLCRIPISLVSRSYLASLSISFSQYNSNLFLSSNGTISGTSSTGPLPLNNVDTYFSESNLPTGYSWSVTLGTNTKTSTVSSSGGSLIVFSEPFGESFSFSVSNVTSSTCDYTATPSSGTISSGGNEKIDYVLSSCVVVFSAPDPSSPYSGNWWVDFNGVNKSAATSSTISFSSPIGNFSYSTSLESYICKASAVQSVPGIVSIP